MSTQRTVSLMLIVDDAARVGMVRGVLRTVPVEPSALEQVGSLGEADERLSRTRFDAVLLDLTNTATDAEALLTWIESHARLSHRATFSRCRQFTDEHRSCTGTVHCESGVAEVRKLRRRLQNAVSRRASADIRWGIERLLRRRRWAARPGCSHFEARGGN
jgi:hypothetical protein